MRVCFYLPESFLPSAESQALWPRGDGTTLEQSGKIAAAQSWIYRTWMMLTKDGCSVELVHALPDRGCVVALSGNVPPSFRASAGLLLAGVVADGLPHPGAALHIVQNAAHARRLSRGRFMPHWPQPGLAPREETRGPVWQRAAFFGTEENLATELRSAAWRDELKQKTDMILEIRGAERWHDYSDVDAVVAIRDFSGARQLHKPATKLYNAWLAGVPFIGGADSAYAAEGEPGADYLVARSAQEVIAHLQRLKRDPGFRNRLVENGRRKSAQRNAEAITAMWRHLVEKEIPVLHAKRHDRPRWKNSCADTAARGALLLDRIFRN